MCFIQFIQIFFKADSSKLPTFRLFLFAAIVFQNLAIVHSTCACFSDQNISSSVAAVTIGSPTENGDFDSSPCAPINCTTVTEFTGVFYGLLSGAEVSIVQCANLSNKNVVRINDNIFSSCPAGVLKFNVKHTNKFTLKYQLVVPTDVLTIKRMNVYSLVTLVVILKPIWDQYSGPFLSDPATARIDLAIGLDSNKSREIILYITKLFTYSEDFVRLSFLLFDPNSTSGTGKYPLWSHNYTTIEDMLNNNSFFPGNNSVYDTTLNTFFFSRLANDFPLRNNTERIFIIFTSTDSVASKDNFAEVNSNINQYDVKFVFINLNTYVATENPEKFPYPQLKHITGTLSNKVHWYDYLLNKNNGENILKQFYFDGNNLCNRPSLDKNFLKADGVPSYYSVPEDPAKLYCNNMQNTQTYISADSNYAISIIISKYELFLYNDFLVITANNAENASLTGQGYNQSYCYENVANVTITLHTYNGLVYTGYQSQTSLVPSCIYDCHCNQNITSLAEFVTIEGPLVNETLLPCAPIYCTTSITFNDTFPNGFPVGGANISIENCSNLSSTNVVTINNKRFTSCAEEFNVSGTNVFVIIFQLKTPVNFTAVFEPFPKIILPSTTITSTVTFKPSETSPFPDKSNPRSYQWIWWICGCIILLLLIAFFIVSIRKRKVKERQKSFQKSIQGKTENVIFQSKVVGKKKNHSNYVDFKNVNLDFNHVLGKGSNATVYKAILKETKFYHLIPKTSLDKMKYIVAAKLPNQFETEEAEEFIREFDALTILKDHPNILALLGWTMMGDIPILLTELAETNLMNHIVDKNQEISEKSNLQILWQISRALEYVAENNMVHRDVAARNILIMKASVVKLADFGLCCKFDEETSIFQDSSHKRFPVKWLSPEVLINRIFSEKSDIWAFGVLCFEVFSGGQEPYINVLYYEMLDYLQAGNRLEKPSHASDAIYMLMLRCWDKDEIKRPKFKQISEEIRVMLAKETYGYLDLNEQKI